jgi:hypothetical protein
VGRWSSDVRRDVIRGSAVCYVAGGLWRSAERSAQENRSFDHYYGTLSGVRGFSDPHVRRLPNGRNVFDQPDPSNPDGYLLPYRLNTKITAAQAIPSMSHEWTVQHEALNAAGRTTTGCRRTWPPTAPSTASTRWGTSPATTSRSSSPSPRRSRPGSRQTVPRQEPGHRPHVG